MGRTQPFLLLRATARPLRIATLVLVITGCAAPATQESQASSNTASTARSAPASASDAPTPEATTATSESTATPVMVGELAQTAMGGLSVRTQPSTGAERLGILSGGETALVIAGPVEADGYTWYRLVSPGTVSMEMCSGENPLFRCMSWIGWVAGITPEGDWWIVPFDPDCRPGRDTAAYLSMDALTRLACAGDDEWRLLAYLAAPGGRGCFSAWMVDPPWMSCARLFPQPVESELDGDSSLAVFIPPELGVCRPGCPWDKLTGSWVKVVGHLDDPVAKTCTYALNSQFVEAPSPPPDPEMAGFGCRLSFVVTAITATTPPAP